MSQQWRITQLCNQVQLHNNAVVELDNASEDALLGASVSFDIIFYRLYREQKNNSTEMQVTWDAPVTQYYDKHHIKRELVIS
jgi:hypothetical protein